MKHLFRQYSTLLQGDYSIDVVGTIAAN